MLWLLAKLVWEVIKMIYSLTIKLLFDSTLPLTRYMFSRYLTCHLPIACHDATRHILPAHLLVTGLRIRRSWWWRTFAQHDWPLSPAHDLTIAACHEQEL